MKKFINAPATLAAEATEGFVAAHADIVTLGAARKHVRRRQLTPGKVAIISGGGAGHEPLHAGFVGLGMLDAACTGHIFTSPTPDQIIEAIDETDTGSGCLLIVKNYDGDVMNFAMASEMAADRHRIETVLVCDDIAMENTLRSSGRRGLAGTVIVEKIIGAAAEQGRDLSALKALGDSLVARIRTMGVALTGVSVPQTRRPTFALSETEMEMGVGLHGEQGRSREPLRPADDIVAEMAAALLADTADHDRSRAVLLVNGFGGTPSGELYLVYGKARTLFEAAGITIARSLVGNFATSLDMAGLSITLAFLKEEEIVLWDAPVLTAVLGWNGRS